MFDLCARDAKHIINYYVLFERSGKEFSVHRMFPAEVPEMYAKRILEFGFFCCNNRNVSEDFVVVFTDAQGTLEFVFCHHLNDDVILCISSGLPWCGCFHNILDIIWRNDMHRESRWHVLHPFLASLLDMAPPPLPVGYISCIDPFNKSRSFRFSIPTSQSPHNLKYVMEYYSSLDVSLWIHVFVCLLLERSVLFYSKRVGRLTSCVLAAVSLLYPLQWVHSFYPLIPRKVLEVLESPMPFVAGIHTCNLQLARDHLNSGTCLVDLDAGQISLFHAPEQYVNYNEQDFFTPKAVMHFLRRQLKEVQHQFDAAISSKKSKYIDWKSVNGDSSKFFQQLTQPFFSLIVNLLGCYSDCLVNYLSGPEVDIGALIGCQACPDLETFMRNLCESQTVRQFLDVRSRERPDPKVDTFEAMSSILRMSSIHAPSGFRYGGDSLKSTTVSAAVPISASVNGSVGTRNPTSPTTLVPRPSLRSPFLNFGSVQWLRAKRVKHPGEPCPWDNLYIGTAHSKRSLGTRGAPSFHQFTDKLRTHAQSFRTLSRSKDVLNVIDNGFSSSSSPVNPAEEAVRIRRDHIGSQSVPHYNRPSSILPMVASVSDKQTINDQKIPYIGVDGSSSMLNQDSAFTTTGALNSVLLDSHHRHEPRPLSSTEENLKVGLRHSSHMRSRSSAPPEHKPKPPPRPPPPQFMRTLGTPSPNISSKSSTISSSHSPSPVNSKLMNLHRISSSELDESPLVSVTTSSSQIRPMTFRPISTSQDSVSNTPSHTTGPQIWPTSQGSTSISSPFKFIPSLVTASRGTTISMSSEVADQMGANSTPDFSVVPSLGFDSPIPRQIRNKPHFGDTCFTLPHTNPLKSVRQTMSSVPSNRYADTSPLHIFSRRPTNSSTRPKTSSTLSIEPSSTFLNDSFPRAPILERLRAATRRRRNNRSAGRPPTTPRAFIPPRQRSRTIAWPLSPPSIELVDETRRAATSSDNFDSLSPKYHQPRRPSRPSLRTCISLQTTVGRETSKSTNLATGDSQSTNELPGGRSEEGSPINLMGRTVKLKKKYATFSQRRCASDMVPPYKFHRAHTLSCQHGGFAVLKSLIPASHPAPIALPESPSSNELVRPNSDILPSPS
ncbi:unnamed protein product [Calicophoron daubneyi]|uniref:UDENN domain-containing protein n=1 Tax=Calicophoron daubneyi TaxID=300641 RepID=A0AAV2U0W9_CALDB